MIVESESVDLPNDNHTYDFVDPLATIDHDVLLIFFLKRIANFFAIHAEVWDVDAYTQLQNNLIDHL
jgi:hypothetical protein